jgi:hypothetical protein
MPASDAAGREDADGLEAALLRASEPGWTAAGLAVVGVAAQMLAFVYGFDRASNPPASPGEARLVAVLGLLVTMGVLTLLARLVDEGWLPSQPALAFLGFGAFVGGVVAFFLPSPMLGAAGSLYLYTVAILIAGGLVTGVLLLAAGIAHGSDNPWWRPMLASPVLLYAGAHAVLLVGLLIQASGLAGTAIAAG